ncbi:MAG: holo-ACP synthase [bacterium JZ-2024 1]
MSRAHKRRQKQNPDAAAERNAPEGSIIGVGTDIIRVSLVRRILTKRPRHIPRLFHPEEIAHCESGGHLKFARYAARFAAKEAFLKALGRRVPLNEVWVSVGPDGRPHLRISDTVRARFPGVFPFVSLSHDGDYATAFVILTSRKESHDGP